MLRDHSACHKKKVSVTTPSVQSVCGGEAKLLLAACKETLKHVSTTSQTLGSFSGGLYKEIRIFSKASKLYLYLHRAYSRLFISLLWTVLEGQWKVVVLRFDDKRWFDFYFYNWRRPFGGFITRVLYTHLTWLKNPSPSVTSRHIMDMTLFCRVCKLR